MARKRQRVAAVHRRAFASILTAATALGAACVPRGSAGNGGGGGISDLPAGDIMLEVVNAGMSRVRIGIDPRSLLGVVLPGQQAGDAITDLTGVLSPGDTATLPLTFTTTTAAFNIFAILPDSGNELLGPFVCEVDRACLGGQAVRAVWTGTEVLCGNEQDAVVELVNGSSATVYLLVEDEQPELPLLPLSPGERRFLLLSRTSALAGSFDVRAVTFNPLLGPTVAAFTQCSVLGICQNLIVTFNGSAIVCTAL